MMMEMNEQYVIVELDEEELEEVAGGRHVQSTGNGVHIRKGPGTWYASKGCIKPGAYTIVEEKGIWLKLKSGEGWISSKYATKL